MDEIKELLKSLVSMAVKNSKDEAEDKKDEKVENESVDKRKLIDEVGGILKGKVDDEIIRTIIGKLEKVAYDKSEAKTADNEAEKSVKEKEEEAENEADEKEEKVDNKCKADNSKEEWFGKLSKIYNSIELEDEADEYVSRFERLEAGKKYFEK